MTARTQIPARTSAPAFTRQERRALQVLRERYRQDRDLFTPRERARLSFLRWLYRTSRLVP